MLEFLQQVRSQFPSCKLTPLVLHSSHLGILHQLGIKLDALDLNAADGDPPPIALHPGEPISNPAVQGRREPSRGASAVGKTWGTVPKVGASAPSAIARPLQERPMHLLPAVSKLGQMQGVMHFAFLGLFDAHHRHPGGLAARVELDG